MTACSRAPASCAATPSPSDTAPLVDAMYDGRTECVVDARSGEQVDRIENPRRESRCTRADPESCLNMTISGPSCMLRRRSAPFPSGLPILELELDLAAVRRGAGADQHLLQRARARGARHHRPERRRQELDAQRHQRHLRAAGGQHHLPRRAPGGHDADATPPDSASPARFRTSRCSRACRCSTTSWPAATCICTRASSRSRCSCPRARREENREPRSGRGNHRLPGDRAHPQDAGGAPALRAAEARRAGPRARRRADDPAARRTDGRHEHRGEAGHVPLHPRRQRPLRHDDRADRARHGRGDGHLRPRRRARLRQEDRRRHA